MGLYFLTEELNLSLHVLPSAGLPGRSLAFSCCWCCYLCAEPSCKLPAPKPFCSKCWYGAEHPPGSEIRDGGTGNARDETCPGSAADPGDSLLLLK